MVTIEISQIIYGVISVGLVILGFLVVRAFRQYDERLDRVDKELKKLRSDQDHLQGEHSVMCKRKK